MTVVQAARYMGAEMKDEIFTPADAGELVKANFAKIPNWFFDSVLPTAPSTFSCLLAFMLRKTVGMSGAKNGGLEPFHLGSRDVARACGIDRNVCARWLHVLNAVGWFEYRPSTGHGKSQFRLVRLPEKNEAFRVALAITHAVTREKEWVAANKLQARENSTGEYTRSPHVPAAGFLQTFQSELAKVRREPNGAPAGAGRIG
jgi:hypothetical protein